MGYEEVDESQLVFALFEQLSIVGTMVDVGAHYGFEMEPFVERGWRVIAFEPDDKNRAKLEERFGKHKSVSIDKRALGSEVATGQKFFASDISTGISGLSAFHESHHETQTVEVTTLNEIIAEHAIPAIDFLKIDVEGFDYFVLQGLNFGRFAPAAIICEYEDRKTEPLGYKLVDVVQFLTGLGYWTVISEWHPIEQYGRAHRWKKFTRRYECVDQASWGNIIALRDPKMARDLAKKTGLDAPSPAEFTPGRGWTPSEPET
jgi:FkbM family methyltransferase